MSRARARDLAETLRIRQDVTRVLAETSYDALEAQSAQRIYLLTGERQYLATADSRLSAARKRLKELQHAWTALPQRKCACSKRRNPICVSQRSK